MDEFTNDVKKYLDCNDVAGLKDYLIADIEYLITNVHEKYGVAPDDDEDPSVYLKDIDQVLCGGPPFKNSHLDKIVEIVEPLYIRNLL